MLTTSILEKKNITYFPDKVNVFFSYAWDTQEHQQWVKDFALRLNVAGANAIIDQFQHFGVHWRTFMETNIKQADIVLIILTPVYRQKLNMPTGVEYEYNIINRELHKLAYNNKKFIPVLREGNPAESIPEFFAEYNFVDLRNSPLMEHALEKLIHQILNTPVNKNLMAQEHRNTTEVVYKNADIILQAMLDNTIPCFEKVFCGKPGAKDQAGRIVRQWEEEIAAYSSNLQNIFNPKVLGMYEDAQEDFKTKVFRERLWTVKAAIKTPDPDLARYKKDFVEVPAPDVYNTVRDILNSTHLYVRDTASHFNYRDISKQQEFKLDFLDQEGMFLNKIIGYGIRSELLHRYYPAYMAIMTQKSLWAMYFMCDNAEEFIKVEHKKRSGQMRISHNWQYPYDRFTMLMNALVKQMARWLEGKGIQLQSKYWFGYANMLLAEINKDYKNDIKMLHDWSGNENCQL